MRSIDPSLLSKIKSQNQTIYNNANPKMSIQVSRAKTTVTDSSYWTVETIRIKEGLGDLSIAARRFKPYGSPNRLYNIYVDNGVVKTAIREYPDYSNEKWKNQFNIGNGSAVAIAFDGHWELYRKKWQLVTVGEPYLFWVDNDGKLYTQVWDDGDSKVELATNVKKVKALRGWKNINFAERDHGIISAYIKNDSKVYYRNYCSQADGNAIWETERELVEFTGVAVNLNLFITNDYRTGFIIEDSLGKIHYLITARNWAGMAIAPEKIVARIGEIKVDFIETTKRKAYHNEKLIAIPDIDVEFLYGNSFNEVENVENIDDGNGDFGKLIKFKTVYGFGELNPLNFKIVDSNNISFGATSISEFGDTEYLLEFDNFNNAKGICSLQVTNAINPAGYVYDGFGSSFTPNDLVPSEIPAPNALSITNEGDAGIIIEFDNTIVSGVGSSISAFTITSRYWKDTFEDVELIESHVIAGITQISDTKIKLNLNPLKRIRRANEINIKYNANLGYIAGETYPLDSFVDSFVPNITKLLDPAIREKITVKPNVATDFLRVTYHDTFNGGDRITAMPNVSIVFTFVGEINP